MKIKLFFSLILIALSCFTTIAEDNDPSNHTVGRVRFVDGNSAVFSFEGNTSHIGLDFLVLLGVSFDTNKGRVELLDLNNNTYWFGRDTKFHFESFDPNGELTTVFLGEGSFICETRLPFSMITASGSILFPAKGFYLIEKNEPGKRAVNISVLKGDMPRIIKKATILNKFHIQSKPGNGDLVAWQINREKDWKLTQSRLNNLSNVTRMPPYMAVTKADGDVSWQRVDYIQPYFRASEFINGNNFNLKIYQLRASGIIPEMTSKWSDHQIITWFTTNRYNAIKWAWDVSNGWHAQFYYDPISVNAAEYAFAPWTHWIYGAPYMGISWACWDRWLLGSSFNSGQYFDDGKPRWYCSHDPREPNDQPTIGGRPFTTRIRPITNNIRIVNTPIKRTQRRITDRTLISPRQIAKLDFRLKDLTRSDEVRPRSSSYATNTRRTFTGTSSSSARTSSTKPRVRVATAPIRSAPSKATPSRATVKGK